MFNLIKSEISSLNKNNKIITYAILSLSFIFLFISGNITINESIRNVDTYNIAIELFKSSILLFAEGITIGTLLNIIDKRKR